MAHYALLDQNNIVTTVIVGVDETDESRDWELFYQNLYMQTCKRTSYNTFAGSHRQGGLPFRKNYAGIGFSYDEDRDAFIPPQPFSSWLLDEETCLWQPPVAKPNSDIPLEWDENTQSWIPIKFEEMEMTEEDIKLMEEYLSQQQTN